MFRETRRRRRVGGGEGERATRRIPLFPDARSSSIKKTRRSSSFPVAPFRVVVAMRELLSVGDAWVDLATSRVSPAASALTR